MLQSRKVAQLGLDSRKLPTPRPSLSSHSVITASGTGEGKGRRTIIDSTRCKWYDFPFHLSPTELALRGNAIARAVQELGLQAPK